MTLSYGKDERGDSSTFHMDRTSVSYRYGYEVAGSMPRYVGKVSGSYGRPAKTSEAEEKAKAAAAEVAKVLRDVGAPFVVHWWTQQVTCNVDYVYDEPILTAVTP